MSGIVRAVHQSFTKLGDTPLARLDLLESLPSRRFGCRASTTNSAAKSRSTSLYNGGALSRGGCRALQLYSAPERSTSLQLYSALHSTSSTPSLSLKHPWDSHKMRLPDESGGKDRRATFDDVGCHNVTTKTILGARVRQQVGVPHATRYTAQAHTRGGKETGSERPRHEKCVLGMQGMQGGYG